MSDAFHPARLLLIGALLGVPATAVAQAPAEEEILVTGRLGTVPESVRSLSSTVSYRDLDLSTKAGKAELRRRVDLTARFLCQTLGEVDAPPAPPCRQAAVDDAMSRVGKVEAGFAPRGTKWVPGPKWTPVYPESFNK